MGTTKEGVPEDTEIRTPTEGGPIYYTPQQPVEVLHQPFPRQTNLRYRCPSGRLGQLGLTISLSLKEPDFEGILTS